MAGKRWRQGKGKRYVQGLTFPLIRCTCYPRGSPLQKGGFQHVVEMSRQQRKSFGKLGAGGVSGLNIGTFVFEEMLLLWFRALLV